MCPSCFYTYLKIHRLVSRYMLEGYRNVITFISKWAPIPETILGKYFEATVRVNTTKAIPNVKLLPFKAITLFSFCTFFKCDKYCQNYN